MHDDTLPVRGHFGMGAFNPKYAVNLGTLIRSINAFGGDYAFTIGDRYHNQPSAVGHDAHLPIFNYDTADEWYEALPNDTTPVVVELTPDSTPLPDYTHPERAAYLLGPEDASVPDDLAGPHDTVEIPAAYCLNQATTGSIVIYDRIAKTVTRKTVTPADSDPTSAPTTMEPIPPAFGALFDDSPAP